MVGVDNDDVVNDVNSRLIRYVCAPSRHVPTHSKFQSVQNARVVSVIQKYIKKNDESRIRQAVREAATICPALCKLTFDLLTLKVISESRVTWATSVPILVYLGLSVLDLRPMYATDRQTSSDVRRQTHIIA